MAETLLDTLRRYGEAHADRSGLAATPIPGLRATCVSRPCRFHKFAISRPLISLILQGAKEVTVGAETHGFRAGDSLLIAADLPTVTHITEAGAERPYLSLTLDLDFALIAELSAEMGRLPVATEATLVAEPTDAEVANAALRLLQLLERPASLPVLQAPLLRELHYWILAGRHGPMIRRLGVPESRAQRIARAVAIIRAEFDQPLSVERLAKAAGMSSSAFHQHFRAVTTLSPKQFQKQLRLLEARRMMLAEGAAASHAAFTVGYASVPQFTREYGRMFGQSPVRDVKAARESVAFAAA